MSTTIKTMIVVLGKFDPNIFSNEVSLTPTRTIRAGEQRVPGLTFNEDIWRMDIDERESIHLEKEIDRLLAVLTPVCDKFRATVEAMDVRVEAAFQVIVEEGTSYPSISLRHDQIENLAMLGMSLDVDIM